MFLYGIQRRVTELWILYHEIWRSQSGLQSLYITSKKLDIFEWSLSQTVHYTHRNKKHRPLVEVSNPFSSYATSFCEKILAIWDLCEILYMKAGSEI